MSPTENKGLEPIKKAEFQSQLEGEALSHYILGFDPHDENSEGNSMGTIAKLEVIGEEIVAEMIPPKGAIETELENKGPGLRALRAYYKTQQKRMRYDGYHKVPSIQ